MQRDGNLQPPRRRIVRLMGALQSATRCETAFTLDIQHPNTSWLVLSISVGLPSNALPSDWFRLLEVLHHAGDQTGTKNLQAHTVYVVNDLFNTSAFYILPPSSTLPFNPSLLPDSTLVDDPTRLATKKQNQDASTPKEVPSTRAEVLLKREAPRRGRGRPTKRQVIKGHLENWKTLEMFTSHPDSSTLQSPISAEYLAAKVTALNVIPSTTEKEAEKDVVTALEKISVGFDGADGLRRIKKVVEGNGVLRTWGVVPAPPQPNAEIDDQMDTGHDPMTFLGDVSVDTIVPG